MANKLVASDYDPFTGITDEFFYDDDHPDCAPGQGRVTIRRSQDIDFILANNREMMKRAGATKDNMFADSNGVHKVATIPMLVIEEMKNKYNFDWFKSTDKQRKKILNNSDFRDFRVRPGKL
tara:strand:- start:1008 stop:1373 length:366 start_codon:yes stop_codon:yes gene_type:complete